MKLERISPGVWLIAQSVVLIVSSGFLVREQAFPHQGDISFYKGYAENIRQGMIPFRDFPAEYPPLAFLPMLGPLLAGMSRDPGLAAYAFWFFAENIVLAALLGLVVFRVGRGLPRDLFVLIAPFFAAAVIGLGSILPWRYDLFPALLSILALQSAVEERSLQAGVWGGLGIAAKIYPAIAMAVIAFYLLAQRRERDLARFILGAVLAVGATFLPFMILSGDRTLGLLEYHGRRGLQLESLPGGLLLLGHAAEWIQIRLVYAHRADEFDCSPAEALLPWLTVLSVVGIGGALLRCWVCFRREVRESGRIDPRSLATGSFFVLATAIVTSRVLSPQFVVWLLPFAPFLPRRAALGFVVVCLLTSLEYPHLYPDLQGMKLLPILVLNLRNLGLVLLIGRLALGCWEDFPAKSSEAGRSPLPKGEGNTDAGPPPRYERP